ncbi:MAG TPA: hypothetical protein VNG13_04065 [Mycobacteriales bacterium]|nr:hypothetical protein [Mycobacteriales bacterium]
MPGRTWRTAKLISGDPAKPEEVDFNHVAAGNAVLAVIAAGNALCCRLLGERARGQDHREAVRLLEQVRFGPGAATEQTRRSHALAAALATALDLKDDSHYGTLMVGAAELRRLIRAADKLVSAATSVM